MLKKPSRSVSRDEWDYRRNRKLEQSSASNIVLNKAIHSYRVAVLLLWLCFHLSLEFTNSPVAAKKYAYAFKYPGLLSLWSCIPLWPARNPEEKSFRKCAILISLNSGVELLTTDGAL
jgi:hypothetical protein